MSKYLYGASIAGIQEFIFTTNKLKEIVGASELVKEIAKEFKDNYKADEILVNAAGNIKAIFNSKEECAKVVLEFSKRIQQKAYGISISQAVVMFEEKYTQEDINSLEKKLKVQRNKPSLPLDSSINIMKLNPLTAKPYINSSSDKATAQKLEAYRLIQQDESFKELSNISNSKNKIAVIHIDGNGLGEVIKNLKTSLSQFSINLDKATKEAFNIAKEGKKVRDIILGGDDVTVICNANDALSFTKEFLENFELQTQAKIGSKLTACAGIAFTNEKYPFHYAVSLAEELCSQTKKQAKTLNKTLAPSSLMFHNIQSSNFQSWSKFVADELTIQNDKQTIGCDFGAYYLDETSMPSIVNLRNVVESLRTKESPSSKLRSWLSELYKSDTSAHNFLERIDSMADSNSKYSKKILNKNFAALHKDLALNNLIVENKTPVYDVLQILSVTEAIG